ncbi:hypothetical protein LN893_18300 [Pontibacter sp. XAAS-A31]|nr:hypothetical protein [Pontibacter harenae]
MKLQRKKHLDKLALTRFRMFTLACTGMATLGIFHFIEGYTSLILACLALGAGTLIGSLVGRTNISYGRRKIKKYLPNLM